ncbi:MAG: hypothetical protein K8T89_09055 [Planctomycetes bacterium]|nr:hypothetical protein [Planctomycetota bacterium]
MKRIYHCLLLAGLLSVGCTSLKNEQSPDSAKKSTSAKPNDVPVAVMKLLPKEELNARNAHAQSQLLNDVLSKEMTRAEKTESAKRD